MTNLHPHQKNTEHSIKAYSLSSLHSATGHWQGQECPAAYAVVIRFSPNSVDWLHWATKRTTLPVMHAKIDGSSKFECAVLYTKQLTIVVLLHNAFLNTYVTKYWMVGWFRKGCGRKQSWPILINYTENFLETLGKATINITHHRNFWFAVFFWGSKVQKFDRK
jgi:hypothetical protein